MSKSKSHSGGGRTPVRTPIKTGPPSTRAVRPAGAANIGASKGDHATDMGTVRRPPEPLYGANKPQVPMGNAVATNVGKGGPGAGRTVHHCGSQGTHGNVNPGVPGLPSTKGQWPD